MPKVTDNRKTLKVIFVTFFKFRTVGASNEESILIFSVLDFLKEDISKCSMILKEL
jgi:hypothetical protein